jgi:uncharacterized delta-60 repeat protein
MSLPRFRFPALLALGACLAAATAGAAPGTLDPTFADDGLLFLDSGAQSDRINGVLADGLGAYATGALAVVTAGSADLVLLKLRADGTLDPAFGNGGVAAIDGGSFSDSGAAIARQPDGRLLVAGRLNNGAYSDWALARFNADGSVDTTFGEADGAGGRRGFVRANIAPDAFTNDEAVDLALQSDGRIVVAGRGFEIQCSPGNPGCGFKYARFALLRFTSDGSLDPGFGSAGKVVSPPLLFQVGEFATGIARRADGRLPADDRITVVGYLGAGQGAVVRRYLANGSPDPSFAVAGTLHITDTTVSGVRTGLSRIDAGRLREDGRLVVVGRGGDRGFAFLGLLADGSRDPGFGTSHGRAHVKFSPVTDYDEPAALALLADGRIAAAGYASMPIGQTRAADFAAVQLLPDGRPDPEFGDGAGRASFPLALGVDEALALAALADGGLLLGGVANDDEAQQANSLAAFARTAGSKRIFRGGFEF